MPRYLTPPGAPGTRPRSGRRARPAVVTPGRRWGTSSGRRSSGGRRSLRILDQVEPEAERRGDAAGGDRAALVDDAPAGDDLPAEVVGAGVGGGAAGGPAGSRAAAGGRAPGKREAAGRAPPRVWR